MKKQLRITKDAYYVCDEATRQSDWYEAIAEDETGAEYRIRWEILDSYRADEHLAEEFACNWDEPYEILDENERSVLLEDYEIML